MDEKLNKKNKRAFLIYLKKHTGFTLMELLVASTIFFIITASSVGVFISSIRAQEYSLNYQQLLNQTSYVMEYMSRSLRMARKSEGTICSDFSGKNYNSTANSVEFVNSNNSECWEFSLENGQLKINKNGVLHNLTSDDLKVNSFKVLVLGDSSGEQPRITIFLDIESRKKTNSHAPRIKIQTTVSQRDLNR